MNSLHTQWFLIQENLRNSERIILLDMGYDSIMVNTWNVMKNTLTQASRDVMDNWLLPAGFTFEESPADIAGYALASQNINFLGGSNLINYREKKDPYIFTAVNLYQSLSYQILNNFIQVNADEDVRFNSVFILIENSPLLIDSAAMIVTE